MAAVIGKIESLDGKFYAKGADGSLRVLSKGDEIFEGEVVIGDKSNSSIDSIIVSTVDGTDVVLLGSNEQLFDASLSSEPFSQDEVVNNSDGITNIINKYGNDVNIDDLETAAGADGASVVESTDDIKADFHNMNNNFLNISASLRDAHIPQTPFDLNDKIDNGLILSQYNELAKDVSVSTLSADLSDATNSGSTTDTITNDATPTITGKTEGGATVVITDASGNTVGSTVADASGNYTITTTELPEGSNDLTVTATDAAGNTAAITQNVTVDTSATAGVVTVDTIAGDNIINAQENGQATQTVSGTATGGDISAGDSVTVTVNGNDYTTTVAEDGTYSVEVATSDLVADGTVDVTVSSTDDAGNSVDTTGTSTVAVTVDTSATAGVVTVDTIAGDNIINAQENGQATQTVSGTATGGDISAGDSVTVTVNGNDYTTTVAEDGTYSVEVATSDLVADGTVDVTVSSTDDAGNSVDTTGTSTVAVDTQASDMGSLAITNIVDNIGDLSSVTISGTGAEAGNTITLYDENNNAVATATVDANGTWNADISHLDGTPMNDNEFFKVTETDPAGNETAQTDTTHYAHYDWADAQTDNYDDFDMSGSGDDRLAVNDNDLNDKLVVDGGSGNDTVVFSGNLADYTITTDENGNTIVTENSSTDSDGNGTGDVNELRNVENIEFADGKYDTSTGVFTENDTTAGTPILEVAVDSNVREIISQIEVVDADANQADGIYERDGNYYTTQTQEVATNQVDIDALREKGYTVDADGNFFEIGSGAKIQIEQEATREVSKVVEVDPIMKVATETTTVRVAGDDHIDIGSTIDKNSTETFDFKEPTSNVEINFNNFNSGSATILFLDADGNQVGSSINQNPTNGSVGFNVPDGAASIEIHNNSSKYHGSGFEVETISYRGESHDVTVEAGGLIPDADAMAAAGIVWSDTQSVTLTQTPTNTGSETNDLQNIGNVGNSIVDGFNPEDHEVSQVFDFGTELANRQVTITVDLDVKSSWDQNATSTHDILTISANGQPIETHNYTSSSYDYNAGIAAGEDYEMTGTHQYTYDVYLDENGQVQLDFMVASTASDEVVNVHNIEVAYEGQTGYVQTVTESETYMQTVFVDAPGAQVNADDIPGGVPYIMTEQTVEVAAEPHMTTEDTVTGYEYHMDFSSSLTDTDGSETLSNITLSNIPDGTNLVDADGNSLSANSDGSYTLNIDDNGSANITLVSSTQIDSNSLDSITTSVTSIESSNGSETTLQSTVGGLDTLIYDGDMNLDLGNIVNNTNTIESIDLGSGTQNISISLGDVLDLTDENNSLKIDGDSQDSVTLSNDSNGDGTADTSWTLGDFKTDAESGATYQDVTGVSDDGSKVTLEINTQIHVDHS